MELPKYFAQLGFGDYYSWDDNMSHKGYWYVTEENEKSEVKTPYNEGYLEVLGVPLYVMDSPENYTNGFKRVKLSNNLYGFLREEDGSFVPYQFILASEFNEYGYAMVAKNGSVGWINRNFDFLTETGKWIPLFSINQDRLPFSQISDFSLSRVPLSQMVSFTFGLWKTQYLGTDGAIKGFNLYDGEKIGDTDRKFFTQPEMRSLTDTQFKPGGYAIRKNEGVILLQNGFYCNFADFTKIAEALDIFDLISKQCEELQNAKKLEMHPLDGENK